MRAQPLQRLDIGNVPGPTCGKHARIIRIRYQGWGIEQDCDSNLQLTLGALETPVFDAAQPASPCPGMRLTQINGLASGGLMI
ncbi:hypothetical protein BEL01nite_83980 [Bradyrhizobium elkanii]|nr:hypothetical protein BEL01nite_83980 [Bradyrhizobium elkanii]